MPPTAFTTACPVFVPAQRMFTWLEMLLSSKEGCVSSKPLCAVHPPASVTLTVYDPAYKPVAVAVVWAGTVLQAMV